jgi:hypothetical protein
MTRRATKVAPPLPRSGSKAPEDEDGAKVVRILREARDGTPTLVTVARIRFGNGELSVETNSVKRADAARTLVKRAAGALVTHVSRELSSIDDLRERVAKDPSALQEPPVELKQVARKMRHEYMDSWVDVSIPALEGRTPREAVHDVRLRRKLDLLLKEIEHAEARLPADERYDVRRLRQRLKMFD